MTQYYSRVDMVLNGDVYSVPFSYINEEDISVYIDDTLFEDWYFLNESQIKLNSTLDDITSESVISIRRNTDIDEKIVVYTNNTILSKDALNSSQDQLLNAIQEMYDNNVVFEANLKEDIDSQIEANKTDTDSQIEELTESVNNQIETFEDEINTQIESVTQAADKINALEEAVTTATQAANEALTSAQTAADKADETSNLLTEAESNMTALITEATETLESITVEANNTLEETKQLVESKADVNLSNLTATGLSQYNVFCINTGEVDEDGNPSFLTYSDGVLTTSGTFSLTSADGTIYTISDTISYSSSELEDGEYNILINPIDKEIVLTTNTITAGSVFPSDAVSGDYLLNISKVPYDLEQITITTETDEEGTETTTSTITKGLNLVLAGTLTISGD